MIFCEQLLKLVRKHLKIRNNEIPLPSTFVRLKSPISDSSSHPAWTVGDKKINLSLTLLNFTINLNTRYFIINLLKYI